MTHAREYGSRVSFEVPTLKPSLEEMSAVALHNLPVSHYHYAKRTLAASAPRGKGMATLHPGVDADSDLWFD